MLTVKRSPARVCWHLLCNGIMVAAKPTRKECEALQEEYSRKYGLTIG